MEHSFALLALVSIAALVFISKAIFKTNTNERLPPGPKPWPLIGNLNLIGSNLHLSFHLLSQQYGDIMQLMCLKSRVIVVSSPEMAKQFLKTHDRVFASRPPFAAGKYTNYNFSDVLWAPSGPHWRQARKITTSEFLCANKLEFFKYIRVEETRNFLSRLCSLSGKQITIRDHVARHILHVISRMVLGEDSTSIDLDELQGLVDEWFQLNGVVYIGDWIPWLGFLDLQGYLKNMKAYEKKFDKFIDPLIDDHLTRKTLNPDKFVLKGGMDGLLQLVEDPNLEVKLTRDCIKGIVQDLLVGGTDSTIVSIEWAIHEIVRNPRIMEEAKRELDTVVGINKWVSENDLSQLPYIDAIIMETMRLHPPVTTLPPHYATEDCNLAGYDIAKGTIVMINVWSIGRDPNTWDSPEKFLPERFLGKEVDMFGNNYGLLPFGSGRRMCPGYNLGLTSIRSTLANLLHGFNWKLPESMKPEDVCMEEEYALATRPKVPLSIIMESILPSTDIENLAL